MGLSSHFRAISAVELAELLATPERIHLEVGSEATAHLELERAWHGLHFLLSGAPWCGVPPLDFIMNGGAPIGDEDVGHGPARGFSAEEVAVIATALAAQTWAELWARWDPELVRAARLYRIDPDAPDAQHLEASFESLRAFIGALAERKQAMLVYMR